MNCSCLCDAPERKNWCVSTKCHPVRDEETFLKCPDRHFTLAWLIRNDYDEYNKIMKWKDTRVRVFKLKGYAINAGLQEDEMKDFIKEFFTQEVRGV